MHDVRLRIPTEDDWATILALADAALPWDADGNREWLANRKQFDGRRRHYLAMQATHNAPLGYGAIEEGPQAGSFRIFLVMDPALLAGEIGERLYAQLSKALARLAADEV